MPSFGIMEYKNIMTGEKLTGPFKYPIKIDGKNFIFIYNQFGEEKKMLAENLRALQLTLMTGPNKTSVFENTDKASSIEFLENCLWSLGEMGNKGKRKYRS